jgi:hypothetical protein
MQLLIIYLLYIKYKRLQPELLKINTHLFLMKTISTNKCFSIELNKK